ncbi:Tetratricopeptide repeat protein 16 [Terramyces sp. JEL0728]|nr:Tetratricopeptide repeat protein 16 [Terramyces sp. JEL0728]
MMLAEKSAEEQAEAYLELTDFDSAILNYRQYILLQDSKLKAASFNYTGDMRYVVNMRYASALYIWGQCLFDQSRFKEASDIFETVLKLKFKEDSARLRLAISKLATGDLDESMHQLFEIINNHCTDADVYILRSKLYYLQKNIFFANLDLRDAVGMKPDHLEIELLKRNVLEYAVDFKNKASEQILRKDYNLGVWYLNQAVELDPEDWSTLMLRGIILGEQSNYESGLVDLMEVLGNQSRDGEREEEIKNHISTLHNQAAIDLYKDRSYLEAVQRFTIALNFNPNDSVIRKNRAESYLALEAYSQALQDLENVKANNKEDMDVHKRFANIYITLGMKAYEKENYRQAIKNYEKVVVFDSQSLEYIDGSADLHFDRARCCFYVQDLEGMKESLETCIACNPSHPHAHALLSLYSKLPTNHEFQPFKSQGSIRNLSFFERIRNAFVENHPQQKYPKSALLYHNVTIPVDRLPKLPPEEGGPNTIREKKFMKDLIAKGPKVHVPLIEETPRLGKIKAPKLQPRTSMSDLKVAK